MHYYTCSNVGNLGSYFQYALLIINAIILLYGCYLAIKVRNVYSDYNESKVIGLSIYGIMICMIIQLIISAVASLGHSVIFIIQSLMIILSSVILLTFMFIPKFWKLHMTGSSQNPNSQPSSRPSNNQNNNIIILIHTLLNLKRMATLICKMLKMTIIIIWLKEIIITIIV